MAIKLSVRQTGAGFEQSSSSEQTYDEAIVMAGSATDADLRLKGTSIAPEQFVIRHEDKQYWLVSRAQGTYLNSRLLAPGTRLLLSGNDQIEVHNHLIFVTIIPEPDSAEARPDGSAERSGFAETLESLKTADDYFSFVVEGGEQDGTRVLLREMETLIGWDNSHRQLAFESARVAAPLALVRKDWSGISVTAQNGRELLISGQRIRDEMRIHHGDQIMFELPESKLKKSAEPIRLTLQEPISLVMLHTLLPKELPPPVIAESDTAPDQTLNRRLSPLTNTGQPVLTETDPPDVSAIRPPHRYFGYFSLNELMMMALGTVAMTLIFFWLFTYLS